MTVLTTVALAALLLEDDYLLALYEGLENLANDLCSFEGGSTNLNSVIGFGEENTVELDGVTFFVLVTEIVNIQELLRLCLELLSLDFYDSVHLINYVTGYTFGREAYGQHFDGPGEAKSSAKVAYLSEIRKDFEENLSRKILATMASDAPRPLSFSITIPRPPCGRAGLIFMPGRSAPS